MKYFLILCLLFTNLAFAEKFKFDDFKKLEKTLGITIVKKQKAVIPGFYKIITDKSDVIYVTFDLKTVIKGQLFKITKNHRIENLTKAYLNQTRRQLLDSLSGTGIIYKSRTEKAIVNVFIDVDCYYCIKVHKQIDSYLRRGISLRYLAKPSGNVFSESYRKLNTIWCSEDRKNKMTMAMTGVFPRYVECESQVAQHYQVSKVLGLEGTPIFILENGEKLVGYQSPEKLRRMLRL